MNAPVHWPPASPTLGKPVMNPGRLHDLTRRAIAASTALTSASIAGQSIGEAEYARIDHAAAIARHALLDCLKHDFGIDKVMAEQLGGLL